MFYTYIDRSERKGKPGVTRRRPVYLRKVSGIPDMVEAIFGAKLKGPAEDCRIASSRTTIRILPISDLFGNRLFYSLNSRRSNDPCALIGSMDNLQG